MKTRLFVAAISVCLYLLFVAGFSLADNNGHIPRVLSELGLTDNTEITSLASSQAYASNSESMVLGNLIDPVPEPRRPKLIDPVPEPRRPKFIDPVPEPRRPKFIDPVPEPRRPK